MWGRGAVVNLSRGAIKGTHLAHEQDQWRVESGHIHIHRAFTWRMSRISGG